MRHKYLKSRFSYFCLFIIPTGYTFSFIKIIKCSAVPYCCLMDILIYAYWFSALQLKIFIIAEKSERFYFVVSFLWHSLKLLCSDWFCFTRFESLHICCSCIMFLTIRPAFSFLYFFGLLGQYKGSLFFNINLYNIV